jgi:hypothetical protein
VIQLLGPLENVLLTHDVDTWSWKLNEEEGFLVKSAFDSLIGFHIENHCSDFELKIFSTIWEIPAPSKVVAFSW